MRNPSLKARHFILVGLEQINGREDAGAWLAWVHENPPERTGGPINQAQKYLPQDVAQIALRGLDALAKHIVQKLENESLDREAAIALENDLGYIQDIETEINQDLRARLIS